MFFPRSIFVLLLLLVLTGVFPARAQEGEPSAIGAAFRSYANRQLTEKLFVHTDKPFYLAGELLWFRIYAVHGTTHQPLPLSKVAYVELLDGASRPVMQAKVALEAGGGSGSLQLPASLVSGGYRLRAYTAWMQNGDPGYFFTRDLSIINTLKAGAGNDGADTLQPTAVFYPEGGQLVAGLQSTVAFRIASRAGRGQAATGVVVDDRNDTVSRFSTHLFGIGRFLFTPEAGRNYRALVRTDGGERVTASLPAAATRGVVMGVREDPSGKWHLTIQATTSEAVVYLLAHTRQQLRWAGQVQLRNGRAELSVDRAQLGEGVSHLTLFDAQQQPVCERLVFSLPQQPLAINTSGLETAYGSRKPVHLALNTRNAAAGVPASLSVAVYQLDSLTVPDGFDIQSYLWLASDLHGIVESPGFYFREKGPRVDLALDNLMLTYGWRRFRWAGVLEGKTPPLQWLPEYNGPVVRARVVDALTGQPAAGIPAYLSIPGVQLQFYTANSDSLGQVRFHTRPFWGPSELIAQAGTDDGRKFRITLASPFASTYAPVPDPHFRYAMQWQPQLVRHSIGTQVQNSFWEKSLSRFVVPPIDSLPFYGQPTKRYLLDDYTRFSTMEEVLREYVTEIAVRKRGDHWVLPVAQANSPGFFSGPPLLLLDGVPLFTADGLMGYDPLKVRKIEVVTNRYFYGPQIFDGIVNFTTYNGTLDGFDLDPAAVVVDYEGLQLQREFAQPDYTDPTQAVSRLPDFRSLLYWNGQVRTDTLGKASLSFFTSDRKGRYIAVVQGLDDSGNCGAGYFGFEVR